MALARWQRNIVDAAGNVQAAATITVRRESPGTPLASLFSDRAGATPISNPFAADADGFAAFHTAGGTFKITATKGAYSQTWRYVGIGTANEGDGPTPAGLPFAFSTVTTDTAPPDGFVAIDAATMAGATFIYISKTGRLGEAFAGVIQRGFNSTNTIKAHVRLVSLSMREVYLEADVSALIVDGTTYWKIPLVNVEGSVALPDLGDVIDFCVDPSGDAGVNGSASAVLVELDFGSGHRTKTFSLVVPGVTVGQYLGAVPSLEMPADVSEDEYELDTFSAVAKVTAPGIVKVIATTRGAPIGRKRNILLSIY